MSEKDTVRVNISPEVAALARREALHGLRWRNAPVASLGAFGIVGGVSFFLDPANVELSPIGRSLNGHWDDLWSAAWLIGGLLVVIGSLRPWQLVELFGWTIYVPALVAYATAVVALSRYVPPAVYLGLSVALGGIAEMVYLIRYAPRVTMIRSERRSPDAETYDGRERRG